MKLVLNPSREIFKAQDKTILKKSLGRIQNKLSLFN